YSGYDPSYPFWWLDPSPFQFRQFNSANDDTLWWALAFIRMYDTLGDRGFLVAAEDVFQRACSQWNTVGCGGGVPWKEPGNGRASTYLNAVTTQLFLQTATKLAGPARRARRPHVASDHDGDDAERRARSGGGDDGAAHDHRRRRHARIGRPHGDEPRRHVVH